MINKLKIICLKGENIRSYINDLARLRINIFKEYPYLYEGSLDYEYKYLQTYASSPECTIALVFDNAKVVGASTSIPMKFETQELQKPFLDQGMNLEEIFYFGESVLLPEYRGQGVYPQFFQIRELAARDYGCKFATFCAVDRALEDSRKPKEYTPLDVYWKKMGYVKHPEIATSFEWKEIGEAKQSPKRMVFWLKTL